MNNRIATLTKLIFLKQKMVLEQDSFVLKIDNKFNKLYFF